MSKRYKKRYKNIVQKRLCTVCHKPVNSGKKSCPQCLKNASIREKKRTKLKISKGLCYRCGKLPIDEKRSKSSCSICFDKCKKYSQINNVKFRAKNKTKRLKLKMEVFNAYGGPKCACCGEVEIKFLTIDHINNKGYIHRKKIGTGGDRLLRWLKNKNFPKGFQILCANCNQGKYLNGGVCPHKSKEALMRE